MMEAGKGLWSLIQDQILGMKWLKDAVGAGLTAMGTDISSRLGGSVHFFIYDIIKITILLCTLIFVISYIQSYFPPERSKRILGRFHGLGARIAAALLGTVTPFCSCSSIPLFMGFTGAGLPLGVTFSFLISSPMVDLGSLVLLTSIFGVKIAAVYVLLGLFVAVLGGTLIEKLHMETQVEEFIRMAGRVDLEGPALTVRDRLVYAREQVESTFRTFSLVRLPWLCPQAWRPPGGFQAHHMYPPRPLQSLARSRRPGRGIRRWKGTGQYRPWRRGRIHFSS